jgi:hypothetical protein
VETDEMLESGYGVGTAHGDNLHNDFAQGSADGFGILAAARGDRVGEFEEFGLILTDSGSKSPFGNVAVLRRPLRDGEWTGAARVMHHFFGQHEGGPYIVFSAWPTPDLREMGFGQIGHPPMMLRPSEPLDDPPVPGLEIRPVDDAGSARDWEYAMVHGFPMPELEPFEPGCFLPEPTLSAGGWKHFVGYLDGAPVATSSAFVGDTHVHVEFISALGTVRGKGIGRAITAAATMAAPELPAMLISSDLGRPVYDRMGYVALLRYTLWEGHRS